MSGDLIGTSVAASILGLSTDATRSKGRPGQVAPLIRPPGGFLGPFFLFCPLDSVSNVAHDACMSNTAAAAAAEQTAINHAVGVIREACLQDWGLTPPSWTPEDEQAATLLAAEVVGYRARVTVAA